MDNINVRPRGGDLTCMAAEFTLPDGRYHVWFDPRTMQLTAPILYKNSLAKYKTKGYFDTRRLNAATSKNAKLIAKLLSTVAERNLVQAVTEKSEADEAVETRDTHVTAIVRDYWVAAMRGAAGDRPEAISELEFRTASARLADRLS